MKSKITKVLSLITLVSLFSVCFAGCSTTTGSDGTSSGSSAFVMIAYMALIFGMLYFFMVRPEKKRKKKLEEMRESLSVGDQITTIGGIVGKVVHIKDDFVILETSEDRVRLEIAKWAIGTNGKAITQDQK
ncbi:MAG: preprotein translocase subunit YajC [Oscillospiraceae bacterium]